MTELRLVDPKTLILNPNNPRKADTGNDALRRLAFNIQTVGLVHPPTVREQADGSLMIVAGHRRTAAAIYAGLTEIPVHVRDGDERLDPLAAASENMIREGMSEPDQWRAVTEMRETLGYPDASICRALMITPAYLKGLSLLAKLHPPILHAIEIERGPAREHRRAIALASLEEQASAWAEMWGESVEDGQDAADYRLNPEDPEDTVDWRNYARHLSQDEWHARDARFDDELAARHGVVWVEDLFGQGDQDNRYTHDGVAFEAAQRDWLENHRPDGSLLMDASEYGSTCAPAGYRIVSQWMGREDADVAAFWLSPRTLQVATYTVRVDPYAADRGASARQSSLATGAGEADAPKERADISGTGHKMIGELRSVALREALDMKRTDVDPWDLVAGLLLALNAQNVNVHGDSSYSAYGHPSARDKAVQALFPEGVLVRDTQMIRGHAIDVLRSFMNCEVSTHSGSGLPAQLLGVLFDADAHMPSLAFEDFLKCHSKPGITKAVQSLGILPRNTGKEMRAALLDKVGQGHWVPEAAGFAQASAVWAAEVAKAAPSAAEEEADIEGEAEDDTVQHQPASIEDEETSNPEAADGDADGAMWSDIAVMANALGDRFEMVEVR